MTDRELLELAAKAAGMEYRWDQLRGEKSGVLRARVPGSGDFFPYWQPLSDDGDALRLAVKLKMDVIVTERDAWAMCDTDVHAGHSEPVGNDPYAATRRAIVRAAAVIGEAMP